jgi:hypothetical protein
MDLKMKCQGVEIDCPASLVPFSSVLSGLNQSEIVEIDVPVEVFQKVINYYSAYNFSPEDLANQTYAKKPIESHLLTETIGSKNVGLLKEYLLNESEVDLGKIKDLTTFLYEYNFIEMREMVLKAIGTQFYCGNTDTEIDHFKKKFGIPDEISPEDQLNIMKEYHDVFEKLNEKLGAELEKAEKTLEY